MLKVLIVDDEMLVRVGIKSTLDWEKYGCTVVAEAANGEEALKKIEVYCPDILFTDIRMPKMDGLELLREIDRRGVQIETVIMSCYNEFELVREAMKLGASDYLLKLSFTEEELIEVLERIGKKIERQKAPDSKNLFSQSELREKLFQKLIDPMVTYEQKKMLSKNLGLCVDFKNAALMILMTDHRYESDKMGYSYLDKQKHNMLLNFVQEYLKSRKQGEIFCLDAEKGNFAVFLNQGLELKDTAEFIQRKINDYLQVLCSVYIFADGMYEQCPDYIVYGTERLENKRYLEGGGQICLYAAQSGENPKRQEQHLRNTYFSGDIYRIKELSDLEERIAALAEKMKQERLPMKECRRIFTECVYNVSAAFRHMGGSLKGLEEYVGYDIMKNLQKLESLDHVICWFKDFKNNSEEYIKECISKQKRSEIETAMRYIHHNYNSPINLKEVAEKAGLSAAYFSTVFKRENEKSFIEYLTDLRVEHAKELLQNRDVCVYEVGELVGYTDSNYFSKIFRKVTGMSPEKYRRQIWEEAE